LSRAVEGNGPSFSRFFAWQFSGKTNRGVTTGRLGMLGQGPATHAVWCTVFQFDVAPCQDIPATTPHAPTRKALARVLSPPTGEIRKPKPHDQKSLDTGLSNY
jgi:hypothetical protein